MTRPTPDSLRCLAAWLEAHPTPGMHAVEAAHGILGPRVHLAGPVEALPPWDWAIIAESTAALHWQATVDGVTVAWVGPPRPTPGHTLADAYGVRP